MPVRRPIAFVCLMLTLGFGLYWTGSYNLFVDFPSILVVFGMTLGLGIIAFRPGEIFSSFCGKAPTAFNHAAVDLFGSSLILTGAFGTIIGLILILANLDDPAHLIPGIATALITLIYGFGGKYFLDSFLIDNKENLAQIDSGTPKSNSMGITILGFVLVFGITMLAFGESIALMIDFPAFLIVIVGGMAAVLVSNSIEDVINSIKGGFGQEYASAEEAKRAVRVSAAMYNRFMSFGVIGTMVGLLLMFVYIEEPDKLGPGMALALISLLYAQFFAMISYARGTAARRQLILLGDDKEMELVMSPSTVGLLTLMITLICFGVLFSAFRMG